MVGEALKVVEALNTPELTLELLEAGGVEFPVLDLRHSPLDFAVSHPILSKLLLSFELFSIFIDN